MFFLSISNNVQSGLEQAKDEVITIAVFLINRIAVPVAAVILIGFLFFNIAGWVNKRNRGEDYQNHVIGFGVCLVSLVLVLSFPFWGLAMIGLGA